MINFISLNNGLIELIIIFIEYRNQDKSKNKMGENKN